MATLANSQLLKSFAMILAVRMFSATGVRTVAGNDPIVRSGTPWQSVRRDRKAGLLEMILPNGCGHARVSFSSIS